MVILIIHSSLLIFQENKKGDFKKNILFLAHTQIYRAQLMLLKSEVLSTYDIYKTRL